MFSRLPGTVLCAVLIVTLATGCQAARKWRAGPGSPTEAGLYTNNLVDPPAQHEADQLGDGAHLFALAEKNKRIATPEQVARRRSVLCLSGGGSYGAFSAGVLFGGPRAPALTVGRSPPAPLILLFPPDSCKAPIPPAR